MLSEYGFEGSHTTDHSLHAFYYILFLLSCDTLATDEII